MGGGEAAKHVTLACATAPSYKDLLDAATNAPAPTSDHDMHTRSKSALPAPTRPVTAPVQAKKARKAKGKAKSDNFEEVSERATRGEHTSNRRTQTLTSGTQTYERARRAHQPHRSTSAWLTLTWSAG